MAFQTIEKRAIPMYSCPWVNRPAYHIQNKQMYVHMFLVSAGFQYESDFHVIKKQLKSLAAGIIVKKKLWNKLEKCWKKVL